MTKNYIDDKLYTTPEFDLIRLNGTDVITSSDWELPEMPLPGEGGGGNSGGPDWELPEIPIPTPGN